MSVAAGFHHVVKQRTAERLNAEINGGQEVVIHEDDVSSVGVGDDDLSQRIEVGHFVVGEEALPATLGEEVVDLMQGSGNSLNGFLLDHHPQHAVFFNHTEELHVIPKELIVQAPAFQIGDG